MTSYQWGYLNSSSTPLETDGNPIKDRLLVNVTLPDTTYDTPMQNAAIEASRLMDIFLKPYDATIPFTSFPLNYMLQMICADFAAGIFKRREYPMEQETKPALQPDFINDVEGSGWFAVGFKRLQDYIKNTYSLGVSLTEASGILTNPQRFGELFSKGYITLMELRTLLINPDAAIQENINRKEINNILNVKSNTELMTKRLYITSKQKSFVFISGGPYGNEDNRYHIDSEAY